jgi:hypothetical protein
MSHGGIKKQASRKVLASETTLSTRMKEAMDAV